MRPARFVARYGSRPNKFGRSGDETLLAGKGATGAAKFTPRGTTYVFVNVVVAPRYVARVQPGSGGLKFLGWDLKIRLVVLQYSFFACGNVQDP